MKSKGIPTVAVNDKGLRLDFVPVIKDNHVIVSFDQARSTFRALKLHHEYNGDTEEVLVSSVSDEIVYKFGSDIVIKNGVAQKVSVPLTMRDGLPTLTIDELCDILGIIVCLFLYIVVNVSIFYMFIYCLFTIYEYKRIIITTSNFGFWRLI